jgi:hypothetical protein
MKPANRSRGFIVVILCLTVLRAPAAAAELKPKTTAAFDKYVSATQTRMSSELRPDDAFLYVDSLSPDAMKSAYEQLKNGEILVEKLETKGQGISSDPPAGMIHHWVGLAFIPGATLAEVLPILQDYEHRAELYKPEVAASHLIWHQGDHYKFFMRLYQKRFTTAVFNTEYVAHWGVVDPKKVYSYSMSTKIAEVKDSDHPDGEEWPVGQGRGYLWRLNTYWRFEEKDGGVYLQCEALSLTRDIPFGLGWLVRPLVTKIPKQSLDRVLGQTRRVVLERIKKAAGS